MCASLDDSNIIQLLVSFAIYTSVNPFFSVGKLEDVSDPLLCCSDTSGVGTFFDPDQTLGKLYLALFNELAIFYDVDGYIRIDISKDIKVYVDILIYLQNILSSHLLTLNILDYSNGAIQLIKMKIVVYLQGFACCYMVKYNTILNTVNIHDYSSYALKSLSSPRRSMMSAIRTYLPLRACRK